MRTRAIPVVLAALLVASVAAADVDDPFDTPDAGAPDAATCARAPDHDKGQALAKAMRDTIAEAEHAPMAIRGQLPLWRSHAQQTAQGAAKLPCDHPAFSAREIAEATSLEVKAAKWAEAEIHQLDAEEKLRAEVVVPLCAAIWDADYQQQIIAHERSNPSGVVDLRVLHDAGRFLQEDRQKMAALKPLYAKARGHAFVKWQDEGACREAAKAQ